MSSVLDIPSDSFGQAGVDDLLLFVGGDDESLLFTESLLLFTGKVEVLLPFTGESLDLLVRSITTCQPGEWLVVLFAIEVSGELTPESVDV